VRTVNFLDTKTTGASLPHSTFVDNLWQTKREHFYALIRAMDNMSLKSFLDLMASRIATSIKNVPLEDYAKVLLTESMIAQLPPGALDIPDDDDDGEVNNAADAAADVAVTAAPAAATTTGADV
jgi:hypothetical protein